MAENLDDAFFDDDEKQDYDDFFSQEGTAVPEKFTAAQPLKPKQNDATAKKSNGISAASDIESEYAMLSQRARSKSPEVTNGRAATNGDSGGGPTTFAMADSDSDDAVTDCIESEYMGDLRIPEVPDAPDSFSLEDLALRESLTDFYMRHKPGNLANVNLLVEQYRGRAVTHLWAQLAIKYKLSTVDCLHVVERTLYKSAPFEFEDGDASLRLQEELSANSDVSTVLSGQSQTRDDVVETCLDDCADHGRDDALRVLCSRGGLTETSPRLRALAWQVMLGYLPADKRADWHSIMAERRAAYAAHRDTFLKSTASGKLELKADGGNWKEALDELQQIKKDVERTHQDFEFFAKPATRCTLMALLFVYAQLNAGVRYVQGMNEVVAILFYVIAAAADDAASAEADTFWCFSALMEEIKRGFMQELDHADGGVHALVGSVDRLLGKYDPELANHLRRHGRPQCIFTFRWCTLLFAQDLAVPEVVRLWDAFIADPQRFSMVLHVCVAAMMACREEMLSSLDQVVLVEALRGCPRRLHVEQLLQRAWSITAIERRKQVPPYPIQSPQQLVGHLSDWAQAAAARARDVINRDVAPAVKEYAPVVKERAGYAAGHALTSASGVASASKEKAQAWLTDAARAEKQKEVMETAQTKLSSLWQAVRTKGAAATTAATTTSQRLAAELGKPETLETAALKLQSAGGLAVNASTAVYARFSQASRGDKTGSDPAVTDAATEQ
eukprot:TRINITY_DN51139_c0_g2_i1.p1 TRINITY_DN51139_c0_g2~~TRINITY_DN51139_c0_g2_i1.p1  ORF type:complete len:749 (-),score=187.43 TRINITY_DN51139_c0_g2_i1:261-2450(-)